MNFGRLFFLCSEFVDLEWERFEYFICFVYNDGKLSCERSCFGSVFVYEVFRAIDSYDFAFVISFNTVFVFEKLGVSSDLPENLLLIHRHISLCQKLIQFGQSHGYCGLNNGWNTCDRMTFRREQYPFSIFYSTSLIFPANFSTISLNALTISRFEVSSDLRYSESPLSSGESSELYSVLLISERKSLRWRVWCP